MWLSLLVAAVLLYVFKGTIKWWYVESNDPWFWGAYGLGAPLLHRVLHTLYKLLHALILSVGPARTKVLIFLEKTILAGIPLLPKSMREYAWEDLDALAKAPTVHKGMQVLKMKRLSHWTFRPRHFSTKESPYTHPLMRPVVFIPGLRCAPFMDVKSAGAARALPWMRMLEEATDTIRDEFLNLTAKTPKAVGEYLAPEDMQSVVAGWRTFFFVSPLSKQMDENIALCPKTWEILNKIPGFISNNMTMFSVLTPGARINPHCGLTNAALRVHLPILCPEPAKSVLRAGDEVRTWEEGKVLAFNDAYDHQVWNFGKLTRVVLFFDVWHPDLTREDLAVFKHHWPRVRESCGKMADEHEKRARAASEENRQKTDEWLRMKEL